MKNRVSAHPNRWKLTNVSGDIYDLERADEPIDEGTPLNKNTLLKDETAQKYGLTNATPNDVLNIIPDKIVDYSKLELLWENADQTGNSWQKQSVYLSKNAEEFQKIWVVATKESLDKFGACGCIVMKPNSPGATNYGQIYAKFYFNSPMGGPRWEEYILGVQIIQNVATLGTDISPNTNFLIPRYIYGER